MHESVYLANLDAARCGCGQILPRFYGHRHQYKLSSAISIVHNLLQGFDFLDQVTQTRCAYDSAAFRIANV